MDERDPFGERPATVNLFPLLLNQLFGAGIPLQPDVVRISDVNRPWDWFEIELEP